MANKHVPHPHTHTPISRTQFREEFGWCWKRSGLRLVKKIVFSEKLGRTHRCNSRRYAEVVWGSGMIKEYGVPYVFFFAPQVLLIPVECRLALCCHEIGHVLAGEDGSEKDADRASLEVLDVEICYDRRWRGKGLQTIKRMF